MIILLNANYFRLKFLKKSDLSIYMAEKPWRNEQNQTVFKLKRGFNPYYLMR